jgi:hypothetical protein
MLGGCADHLQGELTQLLGKRCWGCLLLLLLLMRML